MRKIKLSFSRAETRSENSHEVSDDQLKSFIKESRWRKGTALINGKRILVERLKTFDEYLYRLANTGIELAASCIEGFVCDEYMEWRDG